MLSIYNTKHITWNGTTSINYYELFADTVDDIPDDLYAFSSDKGQYKISQGSLCYVITESKLYMMDSEGNWVLQTL